LVWRKSFSLKLLFTSAVTKLELKQPHLQILPIPIIMLRKRGKKLPAVASVLICYFQLSNNKWTIIMTL